LEWRAAQSEIDSVEAEKAMRSVGVPVAISVGTAPLPWLDGDERL